MQQFIKYLVGLVAVLKTSSIKFQSVEYSCNLTSILHPSRQLRSLSFKMKHFFQP